MSHSTKVSLTFILLKLGKIQSYQPRQFLFKIFVKIVMPLIPITTQERHRILSKIDNLRQRIERNKEQLKEINYDLNIKDWENKLHDFFSYPSWQIKKDRLMKELQDLQEAKLQLETNIANDEAGVTNMILQLQNYAQYSLAKTKTKTKSTKANLNPYVIHQ